MLTTRLPHFNLVLNQSAGFDVLAALSRGLTRQGIRHRFIYPHPKGPLQGSASDARRFLESYQIDRRLLLNLGNVFVRIFSKLILKKTSSNITQTPYLQDHFHPKFLKKLMFGLNVSYTNYGLNLQLTPDLHYSLESYKELANLLVSSPMDVDGFKNAGIESCKVTQIGNPLVFEVDYQRKNVDLGFHHYTTRVLWAPHWTSSWSNWEATLPILRLILSEHTDVSVTFRPHPLLLSGLNGELPRGYGNSTSYEAEGLEQLRGFLQHERVVLSTSSLLLDCSRNDLLVTDGVSIIGFWAATGKPMAVLRRPDSPPFGPQMSDLRNNLDFIDPSSLALVDWVLSKKEDFHNSKNPARAPVSPFLVYENGQPLDPTTLLLRVY